MQKTKSTNAAHRLKQRSIKVYAFLLVGEKMIACWFPEVILVFRLLVKNYEYETV